jgi:hypothetical protein
MTRRVPLRVMFLLGSKQPEPIENELENLVPHQLDRAGRQMREVVVDLVTYGYKQGINLVASVSPSVV